MKTQRKITFTFLVIVLFLFLFTKCVDEEKRAADVRGAAYAGSASCVSCHKNICESYVNTAHHLTSAPANRQTIKGSFAEDSNTFEYRPDLKVVMEAYDSGFYQVAYVNNTKRKSVRFDIVTGSGRKGQTYLYWYNDNIFQLPVSFYVPEKSWVNSPNFPAHHVQFTRNIPIGCFECHASYIQKKTSQAVNGYLVDYFQKDKIIYGIDCERCHGPASAHVTFHQKNPLQKKAAFITTIRSLNRQQKLDMCAVCHSGARRTNTSLFAFKPGDRMSDYLQPDNTSTDTSQVDVHGKQYQLLTASKCFRKSANLTCNTCHNTHTNERNSLVTFSSRCLSCHLSVKHAGLKLPPAATHATISNCIDCHMPARPSSLITLQEQRQATARPALVRTHFISIYPDEAIKFLNKK